MKTILFTLLAVFSAILLVAQVPQAFKYQAVARNSSGEILASQPVSFQISILQGGTAGTNVYTETHDTITNEHGLVNLAIGNGTLVSGDFTSIDWGTDSFFLQIEMDETGNSNYQLLGTSQLLSVPYSINSGSLTLTDENGKTWNITVDTEGNLQINCFPLPTVANAGPDQFNNGSPTTLEANSPDYGIGLWTIISGTGGNIAEPANPTSSFSGIADSSYTLRWTISTICDTTFDDVNISFITSGSCPPTITDFDGNTYNTVQIGTQCWMAENLKTTTYQNGTPIPNETSFSNWTILITGAYVWYSNNISWKDSYGALYNWYTTIDTNGLCPTGWHIPTDGEWTALTDFTGGMYSPHGNKLKSCRQVNSPLGGSCNTPAHPRWNEDSYHWGTDDYGFSGLPGGIRDYDGLFSDLVYRGFWWSSTDDPSNMAPKRFLLNNQGFVGGDYSPKRCGYSVRCLRD